MTLFISIVPSDVPRNVTAIAISSEAVSLRWRSIEESARNAIINTYSINCNYSQQIKTIDAIPSIESNEEAWYSINITGFLPYTMYQCSVYANNSGGAGPNATDIVQTLQDSKLIVIHSIVTLINATLFY